MPQKSTKAIRAALQEAIKVGRVLLLRGDLAVDDAERLERQLRRWQMALNRYGAGGD